MRTDLTAWCRSWRRRDIVYVVLGSIVMVAGMVLLMNHGSLVLLPLLAGAAAFWPTPLATFPLDGARRQVR